MKLNFPPSTDLFQIARDLAKIGYVVSAKRNKDGSHDVFARPTNEQMVQSRLQEAKSVQS